MPNCARRRGEKAATLAHAIRQGTFLHARAAHRLDLGRSRSGQSDGDAAETDDERDTAFEEHQIAVAQTAQREARLAAPSPSCPLRSNALVVCDHSRAPNTDQDACRHEEERRACRRRGNEERGEGDEGQAEVQRERSQGTQLLSVGALDQPGAHGVLANTRPGVARFPRPQQRFRLCLDRP